jgi:D-arabinose 1-dehydrogenase-like Zn-dependent alcohol dehydrogenase
MRIPAYAAMEPKASLQPFSYATPELGAHDVELEVTHCGLC